MDCSLCGSVSRTFLHGVHVFCSSGKTVVDLSSSVCRHHANFQLGSQLCTHCLTLATVDVLNYTHCASSTRSAGGANPQVWISDIAFLPSYTTRSKHIHRRHQDQEKPKTSTPEENYTHIRCNTYTTTTTIPRLRPQPRPELLLPRSQSCPHQP